MDDQLFTDLYEAKEKVDSVKAFLERVYYHPEFSTVMNRPVISMLITASTYLSDNLVALAQKFRLQRG